MLIINAGLSTTVVVLALEGTALAADCEFSGRGKPFSVEGVVVYVDSAIDLAGLGHTKVVAINDSKRGCIIKVQARQASSCSKGKSTTARGTTFVVPFSPIVLAGADNVRCR